MLTLKDFLYNFYQRGYNLTNDEPLILKRYVSENTLQACFDKARRTPYEIDEIYVETFNYSNGDWNEFKDNIKAHLENMDEWYFDITGDPVLIADLPQACNYVIED